MTKDEALKLALEALEPLCIDAELRGDNFPEGNRIHKMADAGFKAIIAIKEALEAPVQEPVGITTGCVSHPGFFTVVMRSLEAIPEGTNLYTAPPAAPVQQKPLFADLIAQHPGLAEELKAMDAAPVQEPVANIPGLADDPSAFIRWALKNNYDTSSHPMFFAMLDPKTNAAREGWKAAVEYYKTSTPPTAQRQWVGLTKVEIAELLSTHHMYMEDFVFAVESKLKEKNV